MSVSEWKRREFLRVLLSLPLGYAVGCAAESKTAPEEALGRLVLALGPWSEGERARAEAFVGRFLVAEHLVGLYLPESSGVIESLARRLPDGAVSVGEFDLAVLSTEEREFVIRLAEQLYSLIEVRFDIANEPRWGVCLGDRIRYTKAPA